MYELMKLYTVEEIEKAINLVADYDYITGNDHDDMLSALETLIEHKTDEEDISQIQSDMCKHAIENIRKEATWIL